MRRKAVRSIIVHTKESIQHLKDDDDEMLRGKYESSATFIRTHCPSCRCTVGTCSSCQEDVPCAICKARQVPVFVAETKYHLLSCTHHFLLGSHTHICGVIVAAKAVLITLYMLCAAGLQTYPCLSCHAVVDWKIVSRCCDVSRSYKTFQIPNDESDSGPKTWRGWFLHLLTLPGILPKSMKKLPGQLWRTISGQEKDMQLGKHTHKGHGKQFACAQASGLAQLSIT